MPPLPRWFSIGVVAIAIVGVGFGIGALLDSPSSTLTGQLGPLPCGQGGAACGGGMPVCCGGLTCGWNNVCQACSQQGAACGEGLPGCCGQLQCTGGVCWMPGQCKPANTQCAIAMECCPEAPNCVSPAVGAPKVCLNCVPQGQPCADNASCCMANQPNTMSVCVQENPNKMCRSCTVQGGVCDDNADCCQPPNAPSALFCEDEMCTSCRCGDGQVNCPNEECDDGNQVNDDACSNTCKLARCGDGIKQAANGEECDDGQNNGKGTCTIDCKKQLWCCDAGGGGGNDGNLWGPSGCSPRIGAVDCGQDGQGNVVRGHVNEHQCLDKCRNTYCCDPSGNPKCSWPDNDNKCPAGNYKIGIPSGVNCADVCGKSWCVTAGWSSGGQCGNAESVCTVNPPIQDQKCLQCKQFTNGCNAMECLNCEKPGYPVFDSYQDCRNSTCQPAGLIGGPPVSGAASVR